jgi:hypothetical protein
MTASMKTEAIEIDHRTVSQVLRQMRHYPDAAMWPTEFCKHVPTQGEVRSVLAALGHEEPTSEDRQRVREIMRAIKLGVDAEAAQLVPSLTVWRSTVVRHRVCGLMPRPGAAQLAPL